MDKQANTSQSLAAAITKDASKQTYYTIRFLVDHGRVNDAYRAYGYFRWVDDVLDAETGSSVEKIAFVNRQKALLEVCYRGERPNDLYREEWMLVDLIRNDTEKKSGLQAYLRNMMDVMVFDTQRRGQIITQSQLSDYSQKLAVAVTEALHFFIGHEDPTPYHEARYLAVTAAHITHMLRDTLEDTQIGYYNIPRGYLKIRDISPQDVDHEAYREWICGRVQLARMYFKSSRDCLAKVKNLRCRLAGYAYTARFEWMLKAIERDNFCLRSSYPERKSLGAGLWISWTAFASYIGSLTKKVAPQTLAVQPVRIKTYEN